MNQFEINSNKHNSKIKEEKLSGIYNHGALETKANALPMGYADPLV